jgi:hypothetical protein
MNYNSIINGESSMGNTDRNPNAGVQGTSSLYKYNSSPNTRAVISQKVRILTPVYGGDEGLLYQIGVVNSFDAGSSSRDVTEVRGIGFGDQIAELVPGVTGVVSVSMERTLLYLSNGHQAFGYAGGVDGPVRTLQQHRWPFDIEQQIVLSTTADQETDGITSEGLKDIDFSAQNASGGDQFKDASGNPSQKHKAIITYFEACWLTEVAFGAMTTDGGIIGQSCSASVTDVHDLYSTYGEFMATGNDPTLGQGASIIYSGLGGNSLTVGADRNFGGEQPANPVNPAVAAAAAAQVPANLNLP